MKIHSRKGIPYFIAVSQIIVFYLGFLNNIFAQIPSGKTESELNFSISGSFVGENRPQAIDLYIWNDIIVQNNRYNEPYRHFSTAITNGKFTFKIDSVKSGMYMTLSNGKHNGNPLPLIDLYRIEQTDSIHMDIMADPDPVYAHRSTDLGERRYRYTINFNGLGAIKYQCRYALDSLRRVYGQEFVKEKEGRTLGQGSPMIYRLNNSLDAASYIAKRQLMYLETFRSSMTENSYQLLKADVIAYNLGIMYTHMNSMPILSSGNVSYIHVVKKLHDRNELVALFNAIPDSVAVLSAQYISTLLRKLNVESGFQYNKPNVYELIIDNYNGRLREKVLTAYLYTGFKKLPNGQAAALLQKALRMIKTPLYSDILGVLVKKIRGVPFVRFDLPDKNGKIYSLNDFTGKVLFIDFFYTGCGNCISYYKNVVSKAEEYFKGDDDIVFATVSIDSNRDKWLNSLKRGQYTSNAAINLYTEGEGASHPLIKELDITGYPHPVLIDREGNLYSNNYKELGKESYKKLIKTIEEALASK